MNPLQQSIQENQILETKDNSEVPNLSNSSEVPNLSNSSKVSFDIKENVDSKFTLMFGDKKFSKGLESDIEHVFPYHIMPFSYDAFHNRSIPDMMETCEAFEHLNAFYFNMNDKQVIEYLKDNMSVIRESRINKLVLIKSSQHSWIKALGAVTMCKWKHLKKHEFDFINNKLIMLDTLDTPTGCWEMLFCQKKLDKQLLAKRGTKLVVETAIDLLKKNSAKL